MRWLGRILGSLFGGGRNVVTETAEVFRPNAEAADQRSADAQSAALQQMAAEFGAGGGWFNRLVNGLNRLPRPLIAFGIVGLFVAAMADPVWFASRMEGLTLVPDQLWTLMGVVVAFYFGAREMHKLRSGAMAREAARIQGQAPRVAENIRNLEALRDGSSPGEGGTGTDAVDALAVPREAVAEDNPALQAWRADRGR
jgi:hypothetical protein